MYGAAGTVRRRRIILVEFIIGLLGMVGVGMWTLAQSAEPGARALGVWLIGAGLNYAPLAVFALQLSRPGALEAELADCDTGRELRRYGVLQLWILVPLALVVFTGINAAQAARGKPVVPSPDGPRRDRRRR